MRDLPASRAALALMLATLGIGAHAHQSSSLGSRPVPREQPQPFPDEALREGENGTVIVSGLLDASGTFHPDKVSSSSGSDRLDTAAIAASAQWIFTPALDSTGAPVAAPLSVKLEYTTAFDQGYLCRQFVLDSDWYDRVHGQKSRDNLRIYKTLRGFFAARHLHAVDSATGDFGAAWDGLIQTCRTNPERTFRSVTSAKLGL